MRGIFESFEQFLMLAAAIALVVIMLSLVLNLWPGPEQTGVAGEKDDIARELAEKSWECFKGHRFGADPKSDVCFTLDMTSKELVTESDVTRFLNCQDIPNNDCEGCEGCVSDRFSEQDKLTYKVEKAETFFKISYSGHTRKVEISGFGCFSDTECDDGNSCTADSCRFPKTLESRCDNSLNCSLCEEGAGIEGSDWCGSCALESEFGLCDDGIDNDCDGTTDAEDDECV